MDQKSLRASASSFGSVVWDSSASPWESPLRLSLSLRIAPVSEWVLGIRSLFLIIVLNHLSQEIQILHHCSHGIFCHLEVSGTRCLSVDSDWPARIPASRRPTSNSSSTNQHGSQLLHEFQLRGVQTANACSATMLSESLRWTTFFAWASWWLVQTTSVLCNMRSAHVASSGHSTHKVRKQRRLTEQHWLKAEEIMTWGQHGFIPQFKKSKTNAKIIFS